MDGVLPLLPFDDFQGAATAVLEHLQERYPLMLWMVTRTEGDDWIVLAAADRGYGVGGGDVFRWTDSFCSRMVAGEGPRIAPTSADVPAYAGAPIGAQMDIGAYMGTPLTDADGGLFGTLCAIDPNPQPPEIATGGAELDLLGRLLSTVLVADMRAGWLRRATERAAADAGIDGLTGIGNRRMWEYGIRTEEVRCRRYGHPAVVIMVDLDGLKALNDRDGHAAGDDLLRRAATAMKATVRPVDMLARVGGDEFGILAVECRSEEGQALAERLQDALEAEGVSASVGWAPRDPRHDLARAVAEADAAMYADKQRRSA